METPENRIAKLQKQGRHLFNLIAQGLRERLWPMAKRGMERGYQVTRNHLMPSISSGTRRIRGELANIHRQQNWLQRFSNTFAGNAAGLGVAMLSTKLLESMVEKRQFSNMWGLFAEHPVVSETTFEVLSFGMEFLVGLVVFTVTEYYVAEYQRRRNAVPVSDIDPDDNKA